LPYSSVVQCDTLSRDDTPSRSSIGSDGTDFDAPEVVLRNEPTTASTPPGWTANPSSWRDRVPLVGFALVGFAIAVYLTLFQLRILETVWEPFFGDGSVTVLRSPVSRLLPVPDAALGALGYLVDAVAGVIGGSRRWRTMPWIVLLFGLAVGPLGAVSIVLVILQPVVFGAWCTLCLASAAISVGMIGPAMDEVLASLQHLRRTHDLGRSTWRAFWGLERISSVA
jgi:uncharacterized membrane protein